MKKGGIGAGSASIVLIFAVLCLTVFAVISLSSAIADSALVEVEATLLKSYYEADTLAEHILAELLEADVVPGEIRGVEILSGWDWDLDVETVSYLCPISEKKELYVTIAFYDGVCDILTWRMRDIGGWEPDDGGMSLWPGDDDEPLNLWSDD